MSAKPAQITISSIAIGYFGILTRLLYMEHTLQTSASWSTWKKEHPTTYLQSNESQIAQQLFNDLQRIYVKETNFLMPFVKFMQETEAELSFLQQYITLYDWIKNHSLSSFFPEQQKTLSLAKQKIARLEFLRQLTVKHMGEYKNENKRTIERERYA